MSDDTTPTNWTRRGLLIAGVAGATAVAAAPIVPAMKVASGPEGAKSWLVAILERHLGHLDVAEGAFEAHVEAWWAVWEPRGLTKAFPVQAFQQPIVRALAPIGMAPPTGEANQRRIDDLLVGSFLMSSDALREDRDTSQPIRWIAWYDPLKRPNTNPLARFDEGCA